MTSSRLRAAAVGTAGRKHGSVRKKRRRPPFLADEALALLLAQYEFDTVLDVGCGDGAHARAFRASGKRVTTISLEPYGGFEPDFVGDFFDFETPDRFALVWCSHTLEHQPNVGLFLRRLVSFAKPDGLLAITVPPGRPRVVGGHLTVWNTGLLLYNLVVAGIDCSQARTKEYGYNVSVIVGARPLVLPPLRQDRGDIERLAQYFPMRVRQGFRGRISQIGWSGPAPSGSSELIRGDEIDPAHFRALPAPYKNDLAALAGIARSLNAPGHVLEFGVFKGRSILALARRLPQRTIHGFDSFDGLPLPWRRSDISTYAAGHFRMTEPPEVPVNVRLWSGRFEDSLPAWLLTHEGPAALVHVDCDLYESTAAVLRHLNQRIVPGTIIVFDELCDWNESGVYREWRAGEWRALVEWATDHKRAVRVLARGPKFSGAVEVVT